MPGILEARLNGIACASIFSKQQGTFVHDIQLASQGIFTAQRPKDRPRVRTQLLFEFRDYIGEISAHAIHFVYKRDSGNAIPVGLPPNGFALRLHSSDSAKYRYGAIQDAKRAFHLGCEIHVARRIDYVQPVRQPRGELHDAESTLVGRRPLTGHRGGKDGNSFALFNRIEIRGGVAVMDLSALMDRICVRKEHAP